MIEKIEWQGKTLALVMRSSFAPDGVNFVTEADNPLQLGVLRHAGGTRIKPHVHLESPRMIKSVQEVLYVVSGRVVVNLYSPGQKEVREVTLETGDTILLISGGHGFTVLEDAKIIEVKQGPYSGVTQDKIAIGQKDT